MSSTSSLSGAILARQLGGLLSPRGRRARLAVFCYHQVLDRRDPLRPGEPDTAEFNADLETIARVFEVLPLVEAVERLRDGRLPARAAAITFDDGYENNHRLAAPLLERLCLPATFFVTGGAIDAGVMWNDLVIEAVARRRRPFDATGVESLGDVVARARSDGELLRLLIDELKYRPLAERWDAAERLYHDNVERRLPRLMMTRAQVADLARRGFDVGGHTLAHPILRELGDAEARAEITGCRDWILEVTGRAPRTFAYPNGKPEKDFNARDCALAEEAGFDVATTTEWSLATHATSPLRIPRIGPWWRMQRSLPSGMLRTYLRSY